jgi:hypothetical protein
VPVGVTGHRTQRPRGTDPEPEIWAASPVENTILKVDSGVHLGHLGATQPREWGLKKATGSGSVQGPSWTPRTTSSPTQLLTGPRGRTAANIAASGPSDRAAGHQHLPRFAF